MINSTKSYNPSFKGTYFIKYNKLSSENRANINGFVKWGQENEYISGKNKIINKNSKNIIIFIKDSLDKKAEEFFSENFIGFKKFIKNKKA